MTLKTRLTARLGIEHPVLSAPMGTFASGALAAAVSRAGGLGLIGGGYGDRDWLRQAFLDAGNERVGCGFITWSLAKKPELLDEALSRSPAAIMLSFGSPAPFASLVRNAGALLICQTQSRIHAVEAIEAGADIVVAQGGEAGGHSGARSTFTLVPEVADLIARTAPNTLLVAAGGVADGRGLAAALMLGADGVLVGSRFVASREAATPEGFQAAIADADGDSTIKTAVADIVRRYDWPEGFAARALTNAFVKRWHGSEAALAEPATNALENERYWRAFRSGDPENTVVMAGEAVGLISDVRPAADIIGSMVAEAEQLLRTGTERIALRAQRKSGSRFFAKGARNEGN